MQRRGRVYRRAVPSSAERSPRSRVGSRSTSTLPTPGTAAHRVYGVEVGVEAVRGTTVRVPVVAPRIFASAEPRLASRRSLRAEAAATATRRDVLREARIPVAPMGKMPMEPAAVHEGIGIPCPFAGAVMVQCTTPITPINGDPESAATPIVAAMRVRVAVDTPAVEGDQTFLAATTVATVGAGVRSSRAASLLQVPRLNGPARAATPARVRTTPMPCTRITRMMDSWLFRSRHPRVRSRHNHLVAKSARRLERSRR